MPSQGAKKQTITPDITYPGCQGNLNDKDKTHHNQRNRTVSMAAIPHGVELLSYITMLDLFFLSVKVKIQQKQILYHT